MKMQKLRQIVAMFLCVLLVSNVTLPSLATATDSNAEEEQKHIVLNLDEELQNDEEEPVDGVDKSDSQEGKDDAIILDESESKNDTPDEEENLSEGEQTPDDEVQDSESDALDPDDSTQNSEDDVQESDDTQESEGSGPSVGDDADDNVPEDNIPEDNTPEDNISEDTNQENNTQESNTQEDDTSAGVNTNGDETEPEVEVASPSCPQETKCEYCGAGVDEEHADDCLTNCECDMPDGEHVEGCPLYTGPVCTCEFSSHIHAEDCELYAEPVTADVYMEEDGEFTQLKGHSANNPMDMESYNKKIIYIVASDEPQNLYFEREHETLVGIYGAKYSIDDNDFALLNVENKAWLGTYKNAILTISPEIPAGSEIVLTAVHTWSVFGSDTVTIRVLEELPEQEEMPEEEIEPIDESVYAVEFSGGENLSVEVVSAEVAHALKEAPLTSSKHHITWRGVYEITADAGTEITLTGLPEFDAETIEIRHYLDDAKAIEQAINNEKAHYLTVTGFEDEFAKEIDALREVDPDAEEAMICYTVMSSDEGEVEIIGLEDGAKAVSFYADSYSIYEVDIVFVTPTRFTDVAPLPLIDNENIETSKTVIYDSTSNLYKLRLESYVKGSVITGTEIGSTPVDVVMILDQSGSMRYCYYCAAQDWTVGKEACSAQKVYEADIDTNEIYFRNDGETDGKVYYCEYCSGWFTKEHTDTTICTASSSSKTGTHYVVLKYASEEIHSDYYFHEAHVCNEECKNWGSTCNIKINGASYYPFAADLDHEKVYYMTSEAGSSTKSSALNNAVAWCSECSGWYLISENHKSGTHEGTRYIPDKSDVHSTEHATFYRGCVQRKAVIQEITTGFIDSLQEEANQYDVAHRLAIIGFGESGTSTSLLTYAENGVQEQPGYTNSMNETYAGKALLDVRADENNSIFDAAINNLTGAKGINTHISKGINVANAVFQYNPLTEADMQEERQRVMILFTDGEPDGDGGLENGIQAAYTSKVAYGATVYTIGIFSGADATLPNPLPETEEDVFAAISGNTNKYMHLMSSNYPTAQGKNDKGADDWDGNRGSLNSNLQGGTQGYYLSADNKESLEEIFKRIYKEISSGGAKVQLDSSTIIQDVISDLWEIDASGDVTAYTMTYLGNDNAGNMQWEKQTTDSEYNPVIEGKNVSVTGFDFSENYVGYDEDTTTGESTARGKKMVMEIPIHATTDNIGGQGQYTNVSNSSGIFYNEVIQEHFDMPQVDLPTDITVEKVRVGRDSNTDFDFQVTGYYFDGSKYIGNDGSSGNYLKATASDAKTSNQKVTVIPTIDSDGKTSVRTASNAFEVENLIVGSTVTITEKDISKYKVEVSLDGGESFTEITDIGADGYATFSFTVEPAMQIVIKNTIRRADLMLTKFIEDGVKPDQSFMFEITGPDNFRMVVELGPEEFQNGKASKTISNLLVGNYEVEELTEWSWRYALVDGSSVHQSVTVSDEVQEANTVSFTNKRVNDNWVDGNSSCQNVFGIENAILNIEAILKKDEDEDVVE